MVRSLVQPVSTARGSTMSPLAAWVVSLAATAASTYVLDAWAAATGAGLVASGCSPTWAIDRWWRSSSQVTRSGCSGCAPT